MPEPPEFGRVEDHKVDKPWGYELRWAITDRYLGKVLHLNKGEALSLQYHERKDECQYVIRGVVEVEGDPGTVPVMVGVPVTVAGRALRWTSSTTMLLRPSAPLV